MPCWSLAICEGKKSKKKKREEEKKKITMNGAVGVRKKVQLLDNEGTGETAVLWLHAF